MNYEQAKKQWNGKTDSKSAYYQARLNGASHQQAVINAVLKYQEVEQ